MAVHYLTVSRGLFVLVAVVLIIDGATSNSLSKRDQQHIRVKRDKRPVGVPISTPIKTDGTFLGGSTAGSPISSGVFPPSSFDESSLTRLQAPGFSRPSVGEFSSVEEDDSLTKLQVPGVSRPSALAAFSSVDEDDSLTKLQVPGVSLPNRFVGFPQSNLDESTLTQLQVPGLSNQNFGGFSFDSDDSLGKRQVSSSTFRPITVGFSRVDVDNAEVKEIALFATKELSKKQNSIVKLNKILLAEAEDVAGKNYKLVLRLQNLDEEEAGLSKNFISCEVIVFDQSWTNTRIIRESDCSATKDIPVSSDDEPVLGGTSPFTSGLFPPNNVADASPTKRQIPTTQRPIGGGFASIGIDDSVKEVAIFAGTAIASKRNSGPARVTKIVKAESQIVAGTNYKLILELNQPLAPEKFLICEVVVFDQSWTKTRILSEHNCKVNSSPSGTSEIVIGKNTTEKNSSGSSSSSGSDSLPKREVPVVTSNISTNKFSAIDVDDPDVKEVAEFAMKVANTAAASSGHSAPVKLVKILKAEWQVVDAVSRNFKLTLELDDGAEESLLCVVSVFEQSTWKSNSSWTNSRTLIESTCFATRRSA
uniref:Cystatin domain-containing protein n=1 Tax=Daphnia galeata TaxID=27404 RepID=A0A8J2RKN6_9CRUS|nr:unnamed protein product [Daphnia galeata]